MVLSSKERNEAMKYTSLIAISGALVLVSGCASAPQVAVLEPVGPAPMGHPKSSAEGSLVVYSARERAPMDINREEWLWNSDFGRNDFLYELAHTDYTICMQDGKVLEHVRNARNVDDPEPVRVTLLPGSYRIEAEAEEDGGGTVNVTIPVVIQPGRTTTAHLAGEWKPVQHFTDADVVRLPDGQIAGWRTAPAWTPSNQSRTETPSLPEIGVR